jgi:hypothetical protein
MTRMWTAALMLALLTGCTIGPRGDRTALAQSPRGANIELVTQVGTLRGELLVMRDSGVVLLTDANRVTLVEYEAIIRGRAEDGPASFTGASARAGRQFDALRGKSRFPRGLQPNVEAELLRLYDQTSLEVVRP